MSRMKPVNDLQAVAKLFRHSPKKEDFHPNPNLPFNVVACYFEWHY